MLFQKNYISPTFSPQIGLGSRSKAYLEKKFVIYLAFTIYWTQRENMTNQNIFFRKCNKKARKDQSHFFLLAFRFGFMRPQTFELSKKYDFSQITFFRKVRENNIHSEIFLKFDSAHFGILIELCQKKKTFHNFQLKFFFSQK